MATWFYQHLPAAEAGEPAPGESPPAARVRWACELAATERWLDATPRADHPDRAHRPRARALAGHEQALVLGDGVYFPALIGFFLALADSRPGDGMLVTINGWRYRASIRTGTAIASLTVTPDEPPVRSAAPVCPAGYVVCGFWAPDGSPQPVAAVAGGTDVWRYPDTDYWVRDGTWCAQVQARDNEEAFAPAVGQMRDTRPVQGEDVAAAIPLPVAEAEIPDGEIEIPQEWQPRPARPRRTFQPGIGQGESRDYKNPWNQRRPAANGARG